MNQWCEGSCEGARAAGQEIHDALFGKPTQQRRADRLDLWRHLMSAHGGVWNPEMTLAELDAAHQHEHARTVKPPDHAEDELGYNLRNIGKALWDAYKDEPA